MPNTTVRCCLVPANPMPIAVSRKFKTTPRSYVIIVPDSTQLILVENPSTEISDQGAVGVDVKENPRVGRVLREIRQHISPVRATACVHYRACTHKTTSRVMRKTHTFCNHRTHSPSTHFAFFFRDPSTHISATLC